jgi:hypothetical protein
VVGEQGGHIAEPAPLTGPLAQACIATRPARIHEAATLALPLTHRDSSNQPGVITTRSRRRLQLHEWIDRACDQATSFERELYIDCDGPSDTWLTELQTILEPTAAGLKVPATGRRSRMHRGAPNEDATRHHVTVLEIEYSGAGRALKSSKPSSTWAIVSRIRS